MQGTTNVQIDKWCKRHLDPQTYLGVFEANTLPKKLPTKPCQLVVSYGKRSHGSSDVLHWCALSKDKNGFGMWLDPMGEPPDFDAQPLGIKAPGFYEYMRRNCPAGFGYNHQRLEEFAGAGIGGTTCGQWSCYMLLRGAPAQNPAAYHWLTTSLRRNNQIILDKVPLLD